MIIYTQVIIQYLQNMTSFLVLSSLLADFQHF